MVRERSSKGRKIVEDIPNRDRLAVVQQLAEASHETFLCRSQIPSPTPSRSLYQVNVALELQP